MCRATACFLLLSVDDTETRFGLREERKLTFLHIVGSRAVIDI